HRTSSSRSKSLSRSEVKWRELQLFSTSAHYAWWGSFRRRRQVMVDLEVIGSQLKTDRFPFQSEGDITLAVRNANYTLGPVMLHIAMKPGAVIPAHLHKG